MRKNILILLALFGLLAVACGPAATPTTAPPAPTSAVAPTQAPGAVATKAPEATKPPAAVITVNNPPKSAAEVDAIDLMNKKVTVTYWHNRPQKDQELLQKMMDEFNKTNKYGIVAKAEIAGASYNDVYSKVSAAIQANQPPEISVAYQNQAAFYRASGAVIDLNPFIASTKYGLTDADKKDYFQAFIDGDKNPQFKGETLGFPTQRSMEVMYVNMDGLKAAGYNSVPTDWKTWEEAACKFSDAAKNKYGFAVRHDASNFATQVFARGGQIISDDGSAYVFNSQAGVETVQAIQRMIKNKCAVEIPSSERFGEQNRFGNGEILFVFSSSSGLPFYKEAVEKGYKGAWDIALLPQANPSKPAMNLYGASVSVYKTTPEKELAAWEVIKFLGQKENTSQWAIATGYLPVRASAKDEVVKAYQANPAWGAISNSYAKMFDWFPYSKIEAPVAGYDPVRALIDKDVLSAALANTDADAKAMLDAAVKKANDILKENAPK